MEETVEDTNKNIINTLQQNLDETINFEDIDRSRRPGKPKSSKNTKPRPIFVKFVRYNTRNAYTESKRRAHF